MPEHSFDIRALHEKNEIIQFYHIAHGAFESTRTPEQIEAETEAYMAASPTLDQEEVWAAFDPEDGRMLGGYLIQYRHFCIDSVTLKTGCIGAVAVAEQERNRGIAAALMRNASHSAEQSGLPLLLLNGIPDFYYRFGYVPVLEETKITIKRSHIQKLPEHGGLSIRKAGIADADILLDLRRRYRRPVGHFERGLAEQEFMIDGPNTDLAYFLAIDEEGNATGYLLLTDTETRFRQQETTAQDWQTLATLLQEYERRLSAHEAAQGSKQAEEQVDKESPGAAEIEWSIPPQTHTFYELVDRIPFGSSRRHHYNADWMARTGNLEALVTGLLPLWTERIVASRWQGSGVLTLDIGGKDFLLRIDEDGVKLSADNGAPALGQVALTAPAFIQLCFGFRPSSWIATREDQLIPRAALPLMNILFPRRPGWIARSDYF